MFILPQLLIPAFTEHYQIEESGEVTATRQQSDRDYSAISLLFQDSCRAFQYHLLVHFHWHNQKFLGNKIIPTLSTPLPTHTFFPFKSNSKGNAEDLHGTVVPNLVGFNTMNLFFKLLRPTPWAPINTKVFLWKGGILATSSYIWISWRSNSKCKEIGKHHIRFCSVMF